MLEASRGSEALQVIDDAGDLAKTPAMVMLRAAALHQVNRHDEETELFASLAPREGVPLELHLVRGLCEDFGPKEAAAVRKLIAAWPRSSALPVLQQVASAPPGKAQWGALRLTDLEYAGQGLKLVELYALSLDSNDCKIRSIAARRLGELHTLEALPALKKLQELPRKKGIAGDDDCGQDAAAASVKKLEHELNP
ncbi:MAG: serine/threonine protein kinase Pkn2 [Myxococcaceae bacterium]|nr:serine/threonine protein kinase Pkn2 [Myxococcaceae bacterium]